MEGGGAPWRGANDGPSSAKAMKVVRLQQDDYDRARARVQALRGFYIHAITYVLVNLMLIVINLVSSPDDLWFYWVTFGWGIALAIHAWAIFASNHPFGPEWEERKIQEELNRNRGH